MKRLQYANGAGMPTDKEMLEVALEEARAGMAEGGVPVARPSTMGRGSSLAAGGTDWSRTQTRLPTARSTRSGGSDAGRRSGT